jgi:uncharacterized protein
MRTWFAANSAAGWATCPITESGFVRVSSNLKVLPSAIGVEAARAVMSALRGADGHRFLVHDVSIGNTDVPRLVRLPSGSSEPARNRTRLRSCI